MGPYRFSDVFGFGGMTPPPAGNGGIMYILLGNYILAILSTNGFENP